MMDTTCNGWAALGVGGREEWNFSSISRERRPFENCNSEYKKIMLVLGPQVLLEHKAAI